MSISTQNCKDFINSISTIIGVSTNDTWKRTKKYKQDTLVLRHFENNKGTSITICEHNGILTLHSLQSIAPVDNSPPKSEVIQEFIEPGMKYIGKEINKNDVAIFLSECANLNPFIEDLDAQKSAKNPNNWNLIEVTFPNAYTTYDLEYKDEEGLKQRLKIPLKSIQIDNLKGM